MSSNYCNLLVYNAITFTCLMQMKPSFGRYYSKSKLKAVTRLASTDQRSAMFQNTFNGTSIKYNGGTPTGNASKEASHDVSYYQDDGSNSLLKNSAQYFELDQNLGNCTKNNLV